MHRQVRKLAATAADNLAGSVGRYYDTYNLSKMENGKYSPMVHEQERCAGGSGCSTSNDFAECI